MIIKSNHEIPLNCDGFVIVFEENHGKNYFIKTNLEEKFDEMELKNNRRGENYVFRNSSEIYFDVFVDS